MRHMTMQACRAIGASVALVLAAGTAFASDPGDPVFGGRTDKPDGSSAVTVGRDVPLDWDTKVGVDVSVAPDAPANPPIDRLLRKPGPDNGSGAAWGKVALPNPDLPLSWDKATVEARIDPSNDQSKLGTTLSRSVPLGANFSMTLQNSYSVIQPLPRDVPDALAIGQPATMPSWGTERSVQLRVAPTDTTFAVGTATTSTDVNWHNKLSAEQKLFGPLSITGAVSDPGTAESSKSISAGFKTRW